MKRSWSPSLEKSLLLAVLLASTSSPAHSLQTLSSAEGSENGSHDLGQICNHTSGVVPHAGFALCAVSDTGGSGLTHAYLTSSAQTGAVEVVAQSVAATAGYGWDSGANISYQAGGSASAQFSDSFTIDSPGRTGTLGHVTAHFKVLGTQNINLTGGVGAPINDNDSSATVDVATTVRLGLASQQDTVSESGTIEPSSHTLDGAITPEVTLTADFLFGTPIDVSAKIAASVHGNARRVIFDNLTQLWVDSVATSNVEYGSSLVWNGITSVTDANGATVATWTALSPTGTDYAVAAPEPEAGTMAAAGLLLLAGIARRRQAPSPETTNRPIVADRPVRVAMRLA